MDTELKLKRRSEREETLLQAAASLCARQGIFETNLRQIAQEANVSNGTLHYYFPSKDLLIETMIVRAVEPMGSRANEIAAEEGDHFERLRAIAELAFGLFDSDWDLYYVALILGDRVRVNLPDTFPTMTDAMQSIIEEGQACGRIRKDEDACLLAVQCHGLIMRVARARVFGELQSPLTQYTNAVAESCRRILIP